MSDLAPKAGTDIPDAWSETLPRVSEILKVGGYVKLDHIPPDILESARQRGTDAHKACEEIDTGDGRYTCPNYAAVPYVESYIRWLRQEKPGILEVEQRVVGDHHGQRYRGTLDRIYRIGGYKVLVDLKTSDRILPAHKVQGAAYYYAKRGWRIKVAILRLLKADDAIAKLEYIDTPLYTKEWLRVLEHYYYRKEHGLI